MDVCRRFPRRRARVQIGKGRRSLRRPLAFPALDPPPAYPSASISRAKRSSVTNRRATPRCTSAELREKCASVPSAFPTATLRVDGVDELLVEARIARGRSARHSSRGRPDGGPRTALLLQVLDHADEGLFSRCLMNPAEVRRTTLRRMESPSLPPMVSANRPRESLPTSTTMAEWDLYSEFLRAKS